MNLQITRGMKTDFPTDRRGRNKLLWKLKETRRTKLTQKGFISLVSTTLNDVSSSSRPFINSFLLLCGKKFRLRFRLQFSFALKSCKLEKNLIQFFGVLVCIFVQKSRNPLLGMWEKGGLTLTWVNNTVFVCRIS